MHRINASLIFVAFAVIALSSCHSTGSPGDDMGTSTTPPPLTPPAGFAHVVVLRNSDKGYNVNFAILDQDVQYHGDAVAGYYFITPVKPGRHMFVSWAENTDAVQIDAEEGKTYFVRCRATWGAWSSGADLLAIKPGTEAWHDLPGWLARAEYMTVDRETAHASLMERKPDATVNRVERGKKWWEEMSDEKRVRRTLIGADGVTRWPSAD